MRNKEESIFFEKINKINPKILDELKEKTSIENHSKINKIIKEISIDSNEFCDFLLHLLEPESNNLYKIEHEPESIGIILFHQVGKFCGIDFKDFTPS